MELKDLAREMCKEAVLSEAKAIRAMVAAMKRAGHAIDPSKIKYTGLHELSLPVGKRIDKAARSSRYRLKALAELFPKGKKMSYGKAKARLNLAASEGPFDGLQPKERLRKALRKKIYAKNPKLKKMIKDY